MPKVEMMDFDSEKLWKYVTKKVKANDTEKYRRITNLTGKSRDTIQRWFKEGTMPKADLYIICDWLEGNRQARPSKYNTQKEDNEANPKATVEALNAPDKLPFEEAIDKAIEEAKTHDHCIYLDNISELSELAAFLNKSVEEVAYEAILLQLESWKNMSVSDFIKRRV